MQLSDSEQLKIQGICGKGFWFRFFAGEKMCAEEFVFANCVPQDSEHFTIYFHKTIQSLVAEGRLYAERSTSHEGSLIAYKNIDGSPKGFPVFDLETYIEHFYPADGDIEPDFPTKLVYSAQNKLHAIAALFQSVTADLELLSDVHFDDNGKELALAVSREIEKLADAFDEKVDNPPGDWMTESLHGVLYHLTRDHHQALVIPEFRRNYLEDIAYNDKLTDEEKEQEIANWLSAVRKQFNLSAQWE